MNFFIENLNQWGGSFLSFAWPMLWQSSLLIVVLFAFDLILRRRLRASIRYAFWLVVLIKLCVPPTLALPTSPAWWLHKTPPPIVAKPARHYTVTYDDGPLPEIPLTPLPAFVPPPPAMTSAAWLLAVFAAVSATLLLWLLARWWQITRLVRRAAASERLTALANAAQQVIGLNLKVRVKLTTNAMSPAVCGLFRPAILIPQSLAANFSDEQLRAVLLHEMIHLRRRDVWLNFLQTLLQILYWWHPLVWLANARIRRVREEAVDDAVMLALRDGADAYAPTLLEVAKLALNRPLVSLGLVGIIESRSALRQRIERLVDFRPPRRAGLTLVSLLEILAFTAVAVPMGDGPSPTEPQTSLASRVSLPVVGAQNTKSDLITVTGMTNEWHFFAMTNSPSVLIQAEIYRMRQTDFAKLVSDPAFANTRKDEVKNFQEFERLVKSSGFSPIARPRIQTSSGMTAQFYVGNETNSIEFESLPLVTNGLIKLANHIKMISMVESVTTTNNTDTQTILQNGGGQIFSIKPSYDPGKSNLIVVTVSVEIVTNRAPHFQQRLQSIIEREPADAARQVDTLVQDGKLYYEMGKLDEAEVKLKAALSLNTNNVAAKYYLELVQSARSSRKWGVTKPERRNIVEKLDRIRIPSVSFDHLSLGEVVRQLSEAARENDPGKLGVNIYTVTNSVSKQPADINSVVINTPSPLKDVPLGDVLDSVILVANESIKYSIMDDGVVFSLKDRSEIPPLYSRHFRVGTNAFVAALHMKTGLETNNISEMALIYFCKIGVNLNVPGKSVFFNERLGELFVRATSSDLDKIEQAIVEMPHSDEPQIHIKARFVEVPKGTLAGLKNVIAVTNLPAGSNQVAGLVGIMTDKNFRTVLGDLEARPGVETLAEPEVVTTSGRQTQMRATRTVTIITNMAFQENLSHLTTNGVLETVTNAVFPEMSKLECGPILDTVPWVLSDGQTIYLPVTASRLEFLGYADVPTNAALQSVTNSVGEVIQLPNFWPAVEISRASANVNMFDGQTLVLKGFKPEQIRFAAPDAKREEIVANWIRAGKKKNQVDGKELIVFVTATIVNPAGNRIHPDEVAPADYYDDIKPYGGGTTQTQ